MSKRGGFPGGMGGFGGMNINNLMKEAKKMQADMEKSQAELATKEFDASAGGGAVTVKVSGEKLLKSFTISTLSKTLFFSTILSLPTYNIVFVTFIGSFSELVNIFSASGVIVISFSFAYSSNFL